MRIKCNQQRNIDTFLTESVRNIYCRVSASTITEKHNFLAFRGLCTKEFNDLTFLCGFKHSATSFSYKSF